MTGALSATILAVMVIISGTKAQFDMTTSDLCTVRMRLSLSLIDEAFGGEETVQRYDMESLVGNKDNFFGITDILFPDNASPSRRRKRQVAATLHQTSITDSLKRVRREFPPPPVQIDATIQESQVMGQISSLWTAGTITQSNTCEFLKIIDYDKLDRGYERMLDIARDGTCADKFGILRGIVLNRPPVSAYDKVQELMCNKDCESMLEKHAAINECIYISTYGWSVTKQVQSILKDMDEGANTTESCRAIQNQTLCPQLAAGCCNLLMHMVQSDFENSIHDRIYSVCEIMYKPDCKEEEEEKEKEVKALPQKPTSGGATNYISFVILMIGAMIARVI